MTHIKVFLFLLGLIPATELSNEPTKDEQQAPIEQEQTVSNEEQTQQSSGNNQVADCIFYPDCGFIP